MKIFALIVLYNLVVRIENCRIGWILLLRFIIITSRIQSLFSNEEYFSLNEENIKSWEQITLLVRAAVLFKILQTELYLHIERSCR